MSGSFNLGLRTSVPYFPRRRPSHKSWEFKIGLDWHFKARIFGSEGSSSSSTANSTESSSSCTPTSTSSSDHCSNTCGGGGLISSVARGGDRQVSFWGRAKFKSSSDLHFDRRGLWETAPPALFLWMLGQTHVNEWSRVVASQNGGSTSYIFPFRLRVLQWSRYLFNYWKNKKTII